MKTDTRYAAHDSPSPTFGPVPDTLLILGTDAAGKDHIASFIADRLSAAGHPVERRSKFFAAPATTVRSSSDSKGRFARFLEQVFLVSFPLTRWLLPPLLPWLIDWDLRRFRRSADRLLVVSYTPVRLLAFCLGHRYAREEDIRLSPALDRALRAIVPVTQARTLVLDVEHGVRQRRIARRTQSGTVDPFDAYMLRDGVRSERIEQFLVWLALTYLNAVKVENNDLDDAALTAELTAAFARLREDCTETPRPQAGEGQG